MHADVMRDCALHLKQAQATAKQGRAPPSRSDMPLLVTHSLASLQQMGRCMKARMKVLKAFSQHQPGSAEAHPAVVQYLEQAMPACRLGHSKNGSDEPQDVAPVHLHLIHLVCVQCTAICRPQSQDVACVPYHYIHIASATYSHLKTAALGRSTCLSATHSNGKSA